MVAMTILAWFVLAMQLFVHSLHSFQYPAANSGVNQWGVFTFIPTLLLKAHAVLVEEHRLPCVSLFHTQCLVSVNTYVCTYIITECLV